MSKEKKIYVLLGVLLIICIIFISIYFSSILSGMQKIKEIIEMGGAFAPIVYVLVQIVQVVLAPIPGQLIGFLGGYFFGVWLGTLYSLIGTIIGTMLVVFLARKVGKPLVVKMISTKTFKKFENFFDKKGDLFLFMIYLLPFFPDDAISAIAGLSKIKIRKVVVIAALGRLPGIFGLSLIGSGVAQSEATRIALILSFLVLISFIIYLKKEYLEDKVHKILHKLS